MNELRVVHSLVYVVNGQLIIFSINNNFNVIVLSSYQSSHNPLKVIKFCVMNTSEVGCDKRSLCLCVLNIANSIKS